MRSARHKVAAAVNALAAVMRRLPSELRARFRTAEERKLDDLLDRIADTGSAPDQDDGDLAVAGEDRGPLVPVDVVIGLLIGVLAVLVLITMLALLPHVL